MYSGHLEEEHVPENQKERDLKGLKDLEVLKETTKLKKKKES